MVFTRLRIQRRLKGLFGVSIPYIVRNVIGDWSPYFGTYEGQRYGLWDTNTCWDFAGIESCETQLEFLWKNNLLSVETRNWFIQNGYVDSDGDFYLSRRWGAILSGVKDGGNDQANFWYIASKKGLIPNSMLPFALDGAFTREQFNADYFNPNLITPEMLAMGQEFLKRIAISYEEVGKRWARKDPKLIMAALKQSPLQIGVPVPRITSLWNNTRVDWDGSMTADHSVELYNYNEGSDYPYEIYDSYEPHKKVLSADYYPPIVTKGVLTPIPTPPAVPIQNKSIWVKIWESVNAWFTQHP